MRTFLVSWFSQTLLCPSQEIESSQQLSVYHTVTVRINKVALIPVHPDSPLSLCYPGAWAPCWTRSCPNLVASWDTKQWLFWSGINSSVVSVIILGHIYLVYLQSACIILMVSNDLQKTNKTKQKKSCPQKIGQLVFQMKMENNQYCFVIWIIIVQVQDWNSSRGPKLESIWIRILCPFIIKANQLLALNRRLIPWLELLLVQSKLKCVCAPLVCLNFKSPGILVWPELEVFSCTFSRELE